MNLPSSKGTVEVLQNNKQKHKYPKTKPNLAFDSLRFYE